MRVITAVAVALVVAACQTTEQARKDDPGPGPFPAQYEQEITDWFAANLKDPYSMKLIDLPRPRAETLWRGLLCGGNKTYYVSDVTYNAKNSFGGYVGAKTERFLFKDGHLLGVDRGCLSTGG